MKKIILALTILILTLGISCVCAETNPDQLPSLAKEIKNALPDIFGQEGFAAAAEGSVGFGDLPGGVDIGVGVNTNRDITFAALQVGTAPVVLPNPPVNPTNPTILTPIPAPYQGPVLYPPVEPPVIPPQLAPGDYYWDYVTPPEPPKTEDSYLDY